MSTYTLEGLSDFILKLFKEENEEELYETWLHKERELSFKDFKNKYVKQSSKTKHRSLSKEEEQENIRHAMRFIKPLNEGGE